MDLKIEENFEGNSHLLRVEWPVLGYSYYSRRGVFDCSGVRIESDPRMNWARINPIGSSGKDIQTCHIGVPLEAWKAIAIHMIKEFDQMDMRFKHGR